MRNIKESLRKYVLFAAVLILSAVFFSCSLIYPTRTPIATSYHYFNNGKQAPILLIMLPGRGSNHEDYVKYGFVKSIKENGLNADIVTVDAHLGYYMQRILIDRIHEDIVMPAKAKGYRSIWLVGISMGGLGSLLYTQMHSESISGLCLMAPFLGEDKLIDEIEKSGGLSKWNPDMPIKEDDYQRELWLWLKKYTGGKQKKIPMYIGFGSNDSFAKANRFFGRVLGEKYVHEIPGDHNWPTWELNFNYFLEQKIFR